MSTQGKIKTLFSDKEKTEALFPRTKISAVSDENGKGLNAILDDMAYVGDITEDVASTPVNADLLGGRPAEEYATQNYVANEIAKAQLEGEDVDLSGYATKDEMNAAIRAIDFPVDSVNGRTGAITLGASDVGAHPDTWLPTIAEIGAAPAGYGLGGMGADCITFNGTIKNGFYSMAGDECVDRPEEYPLFRFGFMFVKNRWDGLIKQTLFYNGISAVRHSIDGGATWEPLEFVNPPMVHGAEYRTTERSNGKAVYTMKFNTGELANGGTFVYRGGSVDVVRYAASCGGAALPFHGADSWGAAWSVWCDVSSTTVTAYMGGSRPTSALDAQVWYTID